jgi:broad specificity phosphatase PhoE
MKILFMRHGFATHNLAQQQHGDIAYTLPDYEDAELTQEGIKQAMAVTLPYPIHTYYCSPLTRCIQTLIYAVPSNVNIFLDDRLMEPQGFHICNKRKEKKVIAERKEKIFDLTNVHDQYIFEKETEADVDYRVRSFMNMLHETTNPSDTVLVITHHDWLQRFYKIYEHQNVSFKNCEVRVFQTDTGQNK